MDTQRENVAAADHYGGSAGEPIISGGEDVEHREFLPPLGQKCTFV